jgi:hypothetical protein
MVMEPLFTLTVKEAEELYTALCTGASWGSCYLDDIEEKLATFLEEHSPNWKD